MERCDDRLSQELGCLQKISGTLRHADAAGIEKRPAAPERASRLERRAASLPEGVRHRSMADAEGVARAGRAGVVPAQRARALEARALDDGVRSRLRPHRAYILAAL